MPLDNYCEWPAERSGLAECQLKCIDKDDKEDIAEWLVLATTAVSVC